MGVSQTPGPLPGSMCGRGCGLGDERTCFRVPEPLEPAPPVVPD